MVKTIRPIKTIKPIKVKKKLRKISALIRDADMWFSRRIRLRDQKDGYCSCVSCGDVLPWKESVNCHFIKRSNYYYRRDPRNCKSGCTRCNMYNVDYHIMKYTIRMVKEHGIDFVEGMEQNHKEQRDVKRDMLMALIDRYKTLVKAHPLFSPLPLKMNKLQREEYNRRIAEFEEMGKDMLFIF